MSIDKTSWGNIAHNASGTATEARTRLAHVFDNDPFVRMFSTEIRSCMIDAFLLAMAAPTYAKAEDAISAYDHSSVRRDAERAMRFMPLGFVTPDFKEHLVSLVAFALIPKPERDEHHRPI